MSAAKDGDTLSEIRHEYKAKKKQLEKYNTFIDRHQELVVFLPLLLVLIGVLMVVGMTSSSVAEQSGNNVAVKVIGLLSLVLLVVAVVMVFITGSRKSAKSKVDKQLEALTKEAAVLSKLLNKKIAEREDLELKINKKYIEDKISEAERDLQKMPMIKS